MTRDGYANTQNTSHSSETPRTPPQHWITPEQSFDLLESISEAFYGVDAEWRFIYLNRKAEQLWGRKREDIIGKNIWDEFPHGVGTQSYHEMHSALKEKQTRRFETFSAFFNRWFEVDIYPTRTGLSVYFRDIHERKLAQVALEHSQQQLRLVTDSLPLLISYVDIDMRYQFVNKGYEAMFGLTRDQIIGKHVAELIGQAAFDATRPELDLVLAGQTVQREQKMPQPMNGRSARIQRLPHIVEDGTVAGIITMIQDITDEKLTQESLSRLAAIITSSSDAIFSATLEGIITSWNPGAEIIFGLSAEQVLHQSLGILMLPDQKPADVEASRRRMQAVAAGQAVPDYDVMRIKPDGSQMFLSVTLSPLRNEHGEVIGSSIIAKDITERKRAEAQIYELNEHLEHLVEVRTAQLQDVNRELDAFAYVVSHDLKAPLRGVTQLAGWLMTDYAVALDEEGREMLKLMVGRSKRMHEMIEGILQYSRVGRIKESAVEINLNKLVAEVVDLLAPPDTIEITIAPDLPVAHGEDVQIRQVFQNLISNAIRHMDKPTGKISITWVDTPTDWQFAIADTGPGIAPQYHEKIFHIFQTLARRDEVESTGIGLALVKKIVELLKGRVWLDSVEGQGTTFYFTLPKEAERHA